MDLWKLKEELATKLLGEHHPDHKIALEAAMRGIQAYMALPEHESKGEIGQKIADTLVPLLLAEIPGMGAYKAILTVFEPHIGEAIDFLTSLAPMEVVDKQKGAVVHDEGQDAPIV